MPPGYMLLNTAFFVVLSEPGCEFQMERIICYFYTCSILGSFLWLRKAIVDPSGQKGGGGSAHPEHFSL